MKLVETTITRKELSEMAVKMFGSLVKAVVDVERGLLVVDAELHSDQEGFLLNLGSKQENLWGINLYPTVKGSAWIEFDSMINLRPRQQNTSRGVDSPQIRKKIRDLVKKKVK